MGYLRRGPTGSHLKYCFQFCCSQIQIIISSSMSSCVPCTLHLFFAPPRHLLRVAPTLELVCLLVARPPPFAISPSCLLLSSNHCRQASCKWLSEQTILLVCIDRIDFPSVRNWISKDIYWNFLCTKQWQESILLNNACCNVKHNTAVQMLSWMNLQSLGCTGSEKPFRNWIRIWVPSDPVWILTTARDGREGRNLSGIASGIRSHQILSIPNSFLQHLCISCGVNHTAQCVQDIQAPVAMDFIYFKLHLYWGIWNSP